MATSRQPLALANSPAIDCLCCQYLNRLRCVPSLQVASLARLALAPLSRSSDASLIIQPATAGRRRLMSWPGAGGQQQR